MRAQWRKFAEEYLKCWNETEAARRAGYSERSAYNQGYRLMKNDEVREYIERRLDSLKMSADEALKRLSDIGRASPETFLTFEGSTWKIDIPKAKREGKLHLIKTITPTRNGLKVELHDPVRAIELIGKHKQLFSDKTIHEHRGQITHRIEGFEQAAEKIYGDQDRDTE